MVSIHNDGIQPLILKQRDLSCNLNYNDGHYCKIANLVAGGYLSSVYRFAPKPVIQFLGYTVLIRYSYYLFLLCHGDTFTKFSQIQIMY